MTTEIEKQFFDTFEIEPYDRYYNCKLNLEGSCKPEKSCCTCEYSEDVYCYPQITDHIMLELFEILRKYYNLDFWTIDNSFVMDVRDKNASYTNILYRIGGDLKHSILSSLELIVNQKLNYNEKIKHQVQAIFKEER